MQSRKLRFGLVDWIGLIMLEEFWPAMIFLQRFLYLLERRMMKTFDGYVDWHQTQKDSIDVYKRKRYPINHKQPNMESDCYYYYRKYRKNHN